MRRGVWEIKLVGMEEREVVASISTSKVFSRRLETKGCC